MLLAAAIQKVQVTNWPAHAALHKVQVTNWPIVNDAGWPTFWVTFAGLVVAIIAATYALLAFLAANEDLKIAKEAQKVASRKPSLKASFKLTDLGGPADFGEGTVAFCDRGTQFWVSVWNTADGQRRCDAFLLQFVLKTADLSLAWLCARPKTGPIGDEYAFSESVNALLFPGSDAHSTQFTFNFEHDGTPRDITIKYRLKDDYQEYPSNGGYSEATVTLPARAQGLINGPRDTAEQQIWNLIAPNFKNAELLAIYSEGIVELESCGITDDLASRVTLAQAIGASLVEKHMAKRRV